MLHKPRGYITTSSDERGRKTVMDLVQGVGRRVYPGGTPGQRQRGASAHDRRRGVCQPADPSVRRRRQAVPRSRCGPMRPKNRSSGCPAAFVLDDGAKTAPAVIHVVSDETGGAPCWRSRCTRAATARSAACAKLSASRSSASSAAPKARSSWACCRRANGGSSKRSEVTALRNAATKAGGRAAAPEGEKPR